MIIRKEFILDEDDIKEAIRDYLDYECDDKDDLRVNFVYENVVIKDNKLASIELKAFALEDPENAEQA